MRATTIKLDTPPPVDTETPAREPGASTALAPHAEPIIEGEVTGVIEPEQKPTPKRRPYYLMPVGTILVCILFLVISHILPLFTPMATVFIIPQVRKITTTTTIQLQGRSLPALTLSQSQTVPATGKKHQTARGARGYITLYNGLFTQQTVASGTILAGNDGVQIATDQTADIPPANPPELGQVTISARAIIAGPQGNIPAYDIDTQCCLTAVKAVNTQAFIGGRYSRDYTIVTRSDLSQAAATLTTSLTNLEGAALQSQLANGEALIPPRVLKKQARITR